MGQNELAERIGIATSSTTALLDRLEQRQLVNRSPHPTDRRRQLVTATAAGLSCLDALRRYLHRVLDSMPVHDREAITSFVKAAHDLEDTHGHS
jgi:DNA-binding MarR family transcriptional regulator